MTKLLSNSKLVRFWNKVFDPFLIIILCEEGFKYNQINLTNNVEKGMKSNKDNYVETENQKPSVSRIKLIIIINMYQLTKQQTMFSFIPTLSLK